MADAQHVRRAAPVAGLGRRGVELHQFEPTVAVRSLHHRVLDPDALEPDHAVHRTTLDLPLPLHLESEPDEERRRGVEVVDHDAHVLQALDRHALDGSGVTAWSAELNGEHPVDVTRPRLVDVRVAVVRRALANPDAELLLEPGRARSGDLENQ